MTILMGLLRKVGPRPTLVYPTLNCLSRLGTFSCASPDKSSPTFVHRFVSMQADMVETTACIQPFC